MPDLDRIPMPEDGQSLDRVLPAETYAASRHTVRRTIDRPTHASGCAECGCTRIRSIGAGRGLCDRCKSVVTVDPAMEG